MSCKKIGGKFSNRNTYKGGEYDTYNDVTFAGENHGRVLTPYNNAGIPIGQKYQWMGPGTQVEKRNELLHTTGQSKPINDLDKCAMVHDNAYLQAGKQYERDKNKPAFMGKVKEADYVFRECAKQSRDDPIAAKIAEKAIMFKEVAETAGLIDSKRFSGKGAPVPAKKIIDKVKRTMKKQPAKKIRKTKSKLLEENELLKRELSKQLGSGECDNINCECDDCMEKDKKIMRKKVPASRLRKAVKEESFLSYDDEPYIGSLSKQSKKRQQGGFLQVLIPVLASLAGTAIGKIFDKVFDKKSGGSVAKLTAEDKRNILIESAKTNPTIAKQLTNLLDVSGEE